MQYKGYRLLAHCTCALLLAALATWPPPCTAAPGQTSPSQADIAVSVRQPRAFGYVIGDELEQRISLLAPAGFALDPKSLPRAGRTGLWLQLAPPHLTSDKRGAATHYLLTLDYRIINVPEQVSTIDLPAVYLVFGSPGNQVTTTVDEWPITIAPITPTYILARAGLTSTQPDTPPPTLATGRYMGLTILWVAAIVLITVGSALLRRGFPWLRQSARPFARAVRDIAKLSRLPPERVTYRRGLQRLHRAFDAAAGHAVFGEHLAPLFAARPELLRLRTDIEQFYAASQREFFGDHVGGASLGEVLALAARCRDAEAAAARRPIAGGHAAPERRPHAV